MDIQVRSNYTSQLDKVVIVEKEEIARQTVGQRLTFSKRHDITFRFSDGSVTLDDIDLIITVLPSQFFCYRGDDVIGTVTMEGMQIDVDLREIHGMNGRAFISIIEEK